MKLGCHAGNAAGKDFALFRDELLQHVGVLIIERFGADIDAFAIGDTAGATATALVFLNRGSHRVILSISAFLPHRLLLLLQKSFQSSP